MAEVDPNEVLGAGVGAVAEDAAYLNRPLI